MHRTPHSFLALTIGIILMGFALIAAPSVAAPRGESVISITSLGKEAAGVEVQPVLATDLPNEITVPGKIEIIPTMRFDQHAPLSGRVAKIDVQPGQKVVKGQTLAIVESTEMNQLAAQFLESRLDTITEFAAQSAKLENEVKISEEQLHLCDENLKRVSRLHEDKIAAQKDVLQAKTDYELAMTRAATAKTSRDILLKTLKAKIELIQYPIRQRLQILGLDEKRINEMLEKQQTLTTVPILAARSGVLTAISASAGMSIAPSTDLFTIADLSRVWATAHVYENDMANMRLGEKVDVRVHALKGKTVLGKLTYIGSQVDPSTRTLPVRCELNNSEGLLKPDMYAELVIETSESAPVISVPKDALVSASPSGSAVFVQDGSNFREVNVRTGRTLGDRVEVADGLKVGDNIVVRGAFQLHAQLVKEHGGEELFAPPTEGEHMEDHAVDNKVGAVHLSMQTVLIIVAAAFLLGFAISALMLFRGQARHECDAELDEEHAHPGTPPAPLQKNISEG